MDMTCNTCGQDHPDVLTDDMLTLLSGYEKQIDSIIEGIMKEAGADPRATNVLRVSFLNILASKMIGKSATVAFERIEETNPRLNSREQLSIAFSVVTSDVINRLIGVYGMYVDEGHLPDISAEIATRSKEEKKSATVH
jgi:hypothetical protein